MIRRYGSNGKILNVGSGPLHIPNAINFDIDPNTRSDVVGDFNSLPFKKSSFDVIYAFDVIEHSPDPELMISELVRVSKPKGKIIVECLEFGKHPENWDVDATHLSFFDKRLFKLSLKPFGFKVWEMSGGMLVGIRNCKWLDRILYPLLNFLGQLSKILAFAGKPLKMGGKK